ELAVLSCPAEGPEVHAAARREWITLGKDRRMRLRGPDDRKPESALPDHAGSAAALDRRDPAKAHRRQDHRQAARPGPFGVIMMRSIHGPAALILMALSAAAFANDAGDPDQSCDGSTAEMVDCLSAKTARWDKRMTIAYQQALKSAVSSQQHDQLRAAQR